MDLSFLKSKNMENTKRLVLTGGGSGGHTFPLIAVAREFKKIAQEKNFFPEIYYIGPNDFTLAYVLKEEGIIVKTIMTGKLNRADTLFKKLLGIFNIFINFFRTLGGIFQSLFYIFMIMPDAIFSKGGHGSFSVIFWGVIFFIPVFTHESDAVPGLVNHFFGRFCRKIFVSFESSKNYFPQRKTILIGNPIRTELLLQKDEIYNVNDFKQLSGLSLERPIITVLGGSQGSQHINDLILDILPNIIDKVEVIHQTGKKNYEKTKGETSIVFQEIVKDKQNQKYYHIVPFLDEATSVSINSLRDIYLISDLIIARAGSGLIFEIAALGKPSILIPLPWASRNHQEKNAYEYAKTGAAIVVEEENLTTNIFSDLVLRLIFDEEKKKIMSEAALNFAKPNAAQEITQLIVAEM